jgi:hypothetical protein
MQESRRQRLSALQSPWRQRPRCPDEAWTSATARRPATPTPLQFMICTPTAPSSPTTAASKTPTPTCFNGPLQLKHEMPIFGKLASLKSFRICLSVPPSVESHLPTSTKHKYLSMANSRDGHRLTRKCFTGMVQPATRELHCKRVHLQIPLEQNSSGNPSLRFLPSGQRSSLGFLPEYRPRRLK